MLKRGDFLKPDRAVEPGVPAFLHPLPAGAPPTRLTFARWLVDRQLADHGALDREPRLAAYFGTGIVATSEDLGTQGEPPSQPELLDWLAVEFMDRGWSLKKLHRLIVTSATYRQSSQRDAGAAGQAIPYNRLLARGPRFRVDAEIVRDIALAASGLLNPKSAARASIRPRRRSCSCRRPVTRPRPGTSRRAGALPPRALHVPLSARCRIRCCRRSTRPTATSPACAGRARTRRCRR